jgi:glycosyltransferase involved in cell wall biosynthesis
VNILFLDQFSDLGGAQHCLLDLVPAVQASGWQISCAVPGRGKLIQKLRDLGVTVHSLRVARLASGRKTSLDFLRFGMDIPRLVLDISRLAADTDLIYVNGPRLLPTAACAAWKSRRPLVFHCHNHLTQSSAQRLAGLSLQLASARVIACCRYVARPLWPYIDPGRLHVIYNGVMEMTCARSAPLTEPRIGVIGRIAPENGQMEFLAAARLLLQRSCRCRFVICGAPLFGNPESDSYFERVRETAADLPVELLGWRDDVRSVLAELDILVVPSSSRTATPRVILEAYAAHVPVVAFACGGIPEIVINHTSGFLVEPPNAEALARNLETLLHAPGQLQGVAGRAYETWKEKFTLERYRHEVLAVIGLTQTLSATGRSM